MYVVSSNKTGDKTNNSMELNMQDIWFILCGFIATSREALKIAPVLYIWLQSDCAYKLEA